METKSDYIITVTNNHFTSFENGSTSYSSVISASSSIV